MCFLILAALATAAKSKEIYMYGFFSIFQAILQEGDSRRTGGEDTKSTNYFLDAIDKLYPDRQCISPSQYN